MLTGSPPMLIFAEARLMSLEWEASTRVQPFMFGSSVTTRDSFFSLSKSVTTGLPST